MATNPSTGAVAPASTIITIMSDNTKVHAYRSVGHMVSAESRLKDLSSSQSILFFDDQGYALNLKFATNAQLPELVRVGTPDTGAVLVRLHTVMDRAIDRINADPSLVQNPAAVIASIVSLRQRTFGELFSPGSELIDEADGKTLFNGPTPHGSWLHRIMYHL